MRPILLALVLSATANAAPIVKGEDLAAGINIVAQATVSSTVTLSGAGAQIRFSSSVQNSVAIIWGSPSGTILTTTTAAMYGTAVWAKSVDGAAVISTGCIVALFQGSNSGNEVLVFSSTNTANVSTVGMIGVTLDNTAAGAFGRVGIAGFFPVMTRTSTVSQGKLMQTGSTRCLADGVGSAGSSYTGAVALKDSPANGALVPAFFFH